MSLCLFVSFARRDASPVMEKLSRSRIAERYIVHAPTSARDPFLRDGAVPEVVIQAYFSELGELDAAVPILEEDLGRGAECEAMTVTRIPVPQPGVGGCSYLVAYAGCADDAVAWHAHYNAHHVPLMAELPGIRELELYAPVEWHKTRGPWRVVRSLQRNKVAFDTAQALEAALQSPVRAKMRADFAAFPPYRGQVMHFPMLSFDPWLKK